MEPIIFIDDPADLEAMAEALTTQSHIALDTESNGFYAYYERICLIQISTADKDYIVDPLALEQITPLQEVLANPKVEKILHAASNDVLGLKRDFQFRFENIFDTAVACKLLGCKSLGLAKILESHFGVRLNKKWQRCDWGRRPLKEEQLDYARLDTHFLIPLRHQLAAVLHEQQLWEAAQEYFAKICQQEGQEKTFSPKAFIQIKGAQSLDPVGKDVLKALYVYREREARRRDRAPFRVLPSDTLVRLAEARPTDISEFSKIKGIPQSFRKGRRAHRLIKIIRDVDSHDRQSEANGQ